MTPSLQAIKYGLLGNGAGNADKSFSTILQINFEHLVTALKLTVW
jgi:hypothetical protein